MFFDFWNCLFNIASFTKAWFPHTPTQLPHATLLTVFFFVRRVICGKGFLEYGWKYVINASLLQVRNKYINLFKLFSWISTDPIDCSSDLCHMAWLILYNRQLLKVIPNGQCYSAGRREPFTQLDRNLYLNCTVIKLSNHVYCDFIQHGV